jgi:hypothetical protein
MSETEIETTPLPQPPCDCLECSYLRLFKELRESVKDGVRCHCNLCKGKVSEWKTRKAIRKRGPNGPYTTERIRLLADLMKEREGPDDIVFRPCRVNPYPTFDINDFGGEEEESDALSLLDIIMLDLERGRGIPGGNNPMIGDIFKLLLLSDIVDKEREEKSGPPPPPPMPSSRKEPTETSD